MPVKIVNLGCGSQTSFHSDVVNVDWSALLRLRRHRVLQLFAPLLVRGDRYERYKKLPANILVHDISKGLPFPTGTIDAIFHSHFLEHLDRDAARRFLLETRRVLKPGGIQRIVVPDFAKVCIAYVNHIEEAEQDEIEAKSHDRYIARILEQSVRREAYGTRQQKWLRRKVETWLLGDARRRGETHQWGYDRVNLPSLLLDTGYSAVTIKGFNDSAIRSWTTYHLEENRAGEEYKPESLYVEAVK